MIPQETVSTILDTARIEDVVGDFVSLKRRGANYTACCPFHNEKTPSFYVSPAKGIYKCFGCGKSGTAVGFVMEHESLSYVEALRYLANKYHIEIIEKEESAEEIAQRQRHESLLLVSEFAWKFFKESLKTPEGQAVGYQYFKSRGLEDETIEKFGLGWAPTGRDLLAKAAHEAGYKEEYLVDNGLCVKRDDGSLSDRFYDRVVFPIHSVSGRVIAFGCRTLRTDKTVAKYVNSPETELYVKSKVLYGLYFAKNEISRQDKCLLVEGYLDVISMHQLGITNVVASSGTSLTVEQVRLIRKFTENVTIIYDGDSAGIHAALRGIGLVLKEGLNVKVVLLPDGDDPDSYSRKHTLEEVQDFISANEQDFISFKTDLLLGEAGNDPLKKANFINDIADTIALIPDPVKRSVYVESCSAKFGIDPQVIFGRIATARRSMLEAEAKERKREQAATEAEQPVNYGEVPEFRAEDIPYDAGQDVAIASDPMLDPYEQNLLRFILNSGQEKLRFDVDSPYYSAKPVTVSKFIDDSLFIDDQSFVNELYYKIYELYFKYCEDGLGQDEIISRMMNGADRQVAGVVSDLVIPKYDLSVSNYIESMTKEESILAIYVPRAIYQYKEKVVERRIAELTRAMAESADETEVMAALTEISQLNEAKAAIMGKLNIKN